MGSRQQHFNSVPKTFVGIGNLVLLSAETLLEEKRMPIRAKYVHTNLIARDWKRLVRFYREVFGCEPKGPERDLSAAWLDRVNSVPNTPSSWRSSPVTWIRR